MVGITCKLTGATHGQTVTSLCLILTACKCYLQTILAFKKIMVGFICHTQTKLTLLLSNTYAQLTTACQQELIKTNTLPATKKLHLNMASAKVVCCMEMITPGTNFGIQTNRVGPDLTAPREAVFLHT